MSQAKKQKKHNRGQKKFDKDKNISYYEGGASKQQDSADILNARKTTTDKNAKMLMSIGTLVAGILKYIVPKYSNYSLASIEENVLRCKPGGNVKRLNSKIEIPGYRGIEYDILLGLYSKGAKVCGLVDIEIQGSFQLNEFLDRILTYQSMMVIMQRSNDYGKDCKPVLDTFNFWVVTKRVRDYKGIYVFTGTRLVSYNKYEYKDDKHISFVIFLDYDTLASNKAERMLNIAFNPDLNGATRRKRLVGLGYRFDKKNIKEVGSMCTYADGIFESGQEFGEIKKTVTFSEELNWDKCSIIKRLMKDFNLDEEEALSYYTMFSKK